MQEVKLGRGLQTREVRISLINKAIEGFRAEPSQCEPCQGENPWRSVLEGTLDVPGFNSVPDYEEKGLLQVSHGARGRAAVCGCPTPTPSTAAPKQSPVFSLLISSLSVLLPVTLSLQSVV